MLRSYWLKAWSDLLASLPAGGPVLALFCIPGFLLLPARAPLAVAAATVAMLALLPERNSRFVFFPLVGLCAVAAGAGMAALSRRLASRGRVRGAVEWSIVVMGLPILLGGVLRFLPPADVPWLAGRITTRDLWRERYGNWDRMRAWTAANLPARSRILMVGESRRIGFRQAVTSTHAISRPAPWQWSARTANPAVMMKAARQEGVDYLVYNLTQANYRSMLWYHGPDWDARQLGVYRRFARGYFTEVYRSPMQDTVNGFFYVLRVGRRTTPARGMIPVLPATEGLAAPAVAAARRGEYARAQELATELVKRVPDVAQFRESAGVVFQQASGWKRAEEQLRAATGAGFSGEWVDAGLAVNALNSGRVRGAFSALARAFRNRPDYREELRPTLAVALLKLGWSLRNSRPAVMRECFRLAKLADPSRYRAVMEEEERGNTAR
jgi:hypothetical protein